MCFRYHLADLILHIWNFIIRTPKHSKSQHKCETLLWMGWGIAVLGDTVLVFECGITDAITIAWLMVPLQYYYIPSQNTTISYTIKDESCLCWRYAHIKSIVTSNLANTCMYVQLAWAYKIHTRAFAFFNFKRARERGLRDKREEGGWDDNRRNQRDSAFPLFLSMSSKWCP